MGTLYRTEHRDILNVCLTWNGEGFHSFCDALDVPIGFAILAQHIHQKKHKAKVAAALKSAPKQAFVKGLIGRLQENGDLEGQTLDPEVKLFRYHTARALFASSTSIPGADPIAELLECEGKGRLATPVTWWCARWRARLCGVDLFKYWSRAARLVALI